MIYLKNKDELKELLKKDKVLIDFYADWCGPCNVLGTILDEIEKDIDIEIVKVNTDNFLSLAREYSILSIPNLKLFENQMLWELSQIPKCTEKNLLLLLKIFYMLKVPKFRNG